MADDLHARYMRATDTGAPTARAAPPASTAPPVRPVPHLPSDSSACKTPT